MNNNINKTKLAGILKSLGKKDRLEARKFLASPYFNSNGDLLLLFTAINALIDKNKALSKPLLWKKIAGNKPYSDVRFRKFCSDLSKLMEQFLAQRAFDDDPIQQQIFLLRSLQNHTAEKLKNSVLREANQLSEQSKHKGINYYLNQYLIQRNFYEIFDYEIRRSDKANLDEISEYLDLLYFSEKLRISCEAIQRSNFKSFNYNSSFTDELDHYLISNNLVEKSPAIALYYQIHIMWKDFSNEEHYYKLKTLIEKHAKVFPPRKAVEDIYTTAQNYCVQKLNKGQGKYLKELFDLFKLLIETELLVIDNEISPWYFRNITVVALRLGEYHWTENFIQKHKDFLPEELKENAVTYNLAQLYFYQKKYTEVIGQLQYVEYNDPSYNLNSKTMLMLTYYELNELDLLDSLLDTFDTFLKRRKDFPEEKKEPYRSLIRYIKKMSRILPNDKIALSKIKTAIKKEGNVVNANWLLEKIAELEK